MDRHAADRRASTRELGSDVHALEADAGGHRLGEQPGALDDEGAFLPTRTAAPQEAPQPLDLGVGEGEAGQADLASRPLLGGLHERGEGGVVGDGEVGQDLAVDLDAGAVEPGDEPAVAHAV